MTESEFQRSVSTASAPRGSVCEWCGNPAAFHLTAIGGASHNDSGVFCRDCGAKFSRTVVRSATASTTTSYHAR